MSREIDALDDHRFAADLAAAAGDLLLTVRRSGVLPEAALGDTGDALAQQLLGRALTAHRPGEAVLSEEAADQHERLAARKVWIIDPLDGTREYREGRHDWAVHVAVAHDGVPGPAAVALPGRDLVLSTATPPVVPPRAAGELRLAVSRSRAPELVSQIAGRLDADLIPMGSAGYKAMAYNRENPYLPDLLICRPEYAERLLGAVAAAGAPQAVA
ncbi:MAG TPA: inositol monophosphatase family protein [Nonomuraea sp.]|nr:inositol monophosphatase family protein [Nonomuraea sp.]